MPMKLHNFDKFDYLCTLYNFIYMVSILHLIGSIPSYRENKYSIPLYHSSGSSGLNNLRKFLAVSISLGGSLNNFEDLNKFNNNTDILYSNLYHWVGKMQLGS